MIEYFYFVGSSYHIKKNKNIIVYLDSTIFNKYFQQHCNELNKMASTGIEPALEMQYGCVAIFFVIVYPFSKTLYCRVYSVLNRNHCIVMRILSP